MGEVPLALKKNARVAPRASSARNQTLLKERSDMDSLTAVPHQEKLQCSPLHILHVYRHVDSEKVECNQFSGRKANKTKPTKMVQWSPSMLGFHGEQKKNGGPFRAGGAL